MVVSDCAYIADKTKPKEVSRISWQSLNEGFMHTVVPILDRGLLVASQESTKEGCIDWPMRITIVDIQNEARPPARVPATAGELV